MNHLFFCRNYGLHCFHITTHICLIDNGSSFSSVQGFYSVCLRLEHDAMFDFQDPLKNGVLAVQTIRNNIMASTLLATTAITLSSLIGVFVSSSSDMSNAKLHLIYGNKSALCTSIKYFSILLCFLVAFLCNVQSIRYYAHVSFLVTVPTWRDQKESIQYVARNLNRGSHFWSVGLRAFYFSFPLFLWIFGPIPMFACCCIMLCILYFLDTTTSFTRQLHTRSLKDDQQVDLESPRQAL